MKYWLGEVYTGGSIVVTEFAGRWAAVSASLRPLDHPEAVTWLEATVP
jgi:hypothetical protein